MSAFLTDKAAAIGRRIRGVRTVEPAPRRGPYDATVYQTTHLTGGAATGADPRTSAVNRFGQSWDVPNVFVGGSALFPQNSAYNPTGTVGAMAYWAAEAIRDRYARAPGPLVPT